MEKEPEVSATGNDLFRIKNLSSDFLKSEAASVPGKGAGANMEDSESEAEEGKGTEDTTERPEQPSTSLDFALKRGLTETGLLNKRSSLAVAMDKL